MIPQRRKPPVHKAIKIPIGPYDVADAFTLSELVLLEFEFHSFLFDFDDALLAGRVPVLFLLFFISPDADFRVALAEAAATLATSA